MPTSLVTCGLLTSAAIIVCIVYDETIGFNMVMCLFCVLANRQSCRLRVLESARGIAFDMPCVFLMR